MAVRFFNGSSYLSNLAFRPASFPVTISAWIRPEVLGAGSYQRAVTLMDSTSNTISSILINYPNSGNVSNQVYNGGTNALPYNTGLVANTWHHVIVISTSSSCTVYLNGVQGTIATYGTTTYSNPLDRLHFGYIPSTQYYYGSVAQVGVWNTVLSADDIKALSNAYSPDMVCRNNLIAYYPLGGNYSDYKKERWKDKYDLTLTGTIQEIDHPRVRYKGLNKHSYVINSTSQIYFGDISFNFDSIFNKTSNITINSNKNLISISNISLYSNRIVNPNIILLNSIESNIDSNKVISGISSYHIDSLTQLEPTRIISPHITLNNENNLSSVGSLLIDETSALSVSTKITPQSQKIIQSVSDFLTSSELTSSASTTVYSVLNFIQENNLTVIPSLVFNSQFTGSLNSSLETATQRVLNNSIFISGNNTFSTLSSLIISGLFGPNTDSILDSSLVQVDTGEILYGEAVFQTLTRLGLSPSLLMNGTSRLASNSISNMDSARIILPAVELSVDTNTSTICSSIVSGITQLKAFSNLDVLSQRVISGNFNTSSDSLLFGSFNRIVSADLEYKLVSDFLTSSTRIQGGTLVLSNETSVDSDGFRIIDGVLIYEADASLLTLTGQTFYNLISFENSSKIFPSIVKLTIVPITLKIAKNIEIDLPIVKAYESSIKINREKEIQLKIRKEYT